MPGIVDSRVKRKRERWSVRKGVGLEIDGAEKEVGANMVGERRSICEEMETKRRERG